MGTELFSEVLINENTQLRELLHHIMSGLNDGHGAAWISCSLPPHLQTLYDSFVTTDAASQYGQPEERQEPH